MFGHVPQAAIFFALASPIALAQESAAINVPDTVRAGETVTFQITLDAAPNFEGASVMYWVGCSSGFSIQSGAEVTKGSNSTIFSIRLPADVSSGTCRVDQLKFYSGSRTYDLHFPSVSFRVLGNAGLVIPSSAEVAINPTQTQLLRREATRLQLQIQQLKAELSSGPSVRSGGDILRKRVQEELSSLQETARKFRELSASGTTNDASDIFFSDLRVSYDEVLSALNHPQAARSQLRPFLIQAAFSVADGMGAPSDAKYSLAALAVFRAFEQNELAYTLVADTGALTFDLAVSSSPEGATVSYKRRGDPYQPLPSPTNSVIKAIPYAIWIVRFQKPGFKDQEIEHDPFREPNHVVTADLIKK